MMYGDDEFPLDPIPMQPMPTIAEVLEVQATIEPPTKKKKAFLPSPCASVVQYTQIWKPPNT